MDYSIAADSIRKRVTPTTPIFAREMLDSVEAMTVREELKVWNNAMVDLHDVNQTDIVWARSASTPLHFRSPRRWWERIGIVKWVCRASRRLQRGRN